MLASRRRKVSSGAPCTPRLNSSLVCIMNIRTIFYIVNSNNSKNFSRNIKQVDDGGTPSSWRMDLSSMIIREHSSCSRQTVTTVILSPCLLSSAALSSEHCSNLHESQASLRVLPLEDGLLSLSHPQFPSPRNVHVTPGTQVYKTGVELKHLLLTNHKEVCLKRFLDIHILPFIHDKSKFAL